MNEIMKKGEKEGQQQGGEIDDPFPILLSLFFVIGMLGPDFLPCRTISRSKRCFFPLCLCPSFFSLCKKNTAVFYRSDRTGGLVEQGSLSALAFLDHLQSFTPPKRYG